MSSKNNVQSYKKTIELQKNKSKKRFSNIVKKINSTFFNFRKQKWSKTHSFTP